MAGDRIQRTDIEIRKVGDEWCAFYGDKELGRSKEKELLHSWLKDALGSR